MRSAIIKKASPDEQQNQTTIKTNYIQNLMSILKKTHKQGQNSINKTETKQINF